MERKIIQRGDYVDHGVIHEVFGMTGEKSIHGKLRKFKRHLIVGDMFLVPQEHVGIRYDFKIPDPMTFVVAKKYAHCVELHHKSPFTDYVHVYTPSYTTLYMVGMRMRRRHKVEK